MQMFEEIMVVSTKLNKLSLKVLKGSSNLKGIQLLLICEWLELLFVTYAIRENPQLLGLEINIHADEKVFAGQRTSKDLSPNNTVRKEFNPNWFLTNTLCLKDLVICSFKIFFMRFPRIRWQNLRINHSYVGSSIHVSNNLYRSSILGGEQMNVDTGRWNHLCAKNKSS